MSDRPPTGSTQEIAQAIAQISERAQTLVRDEIELARVELQAKAKTLGTGAAIAIAVGIFVIFATSLILTGLSWLAWYELFPDQQFFWGFFLVAGVLLVIAAIAGWVAYRKLQTKPTPDMAIEEAQRIRDTIAPPDPVAPGAAPPAPGGVSVPPAGVSVPATPVSPPPTPVSPPPTPAPAPVSPPPAPAPPPEPPTPPASADEPPTPPEQGAS